MFSTAQVRTCNQVKNGQARFVGMEGDLPLQSHAWETTHAWNTYRAHRARRISVEKLEPIAKWKNYWIIDQRWAYL
jgi:hypothetical protein